VCRSFNLTNNLNFTLETQFVEISISPEPELTIAAVVLNKGELTRLGAQTSTFQTEQKSWIIKVSNLKEKVDSLLLSLEIKSCMGFNGMFDVFVEMYQQDRHNLTKSLQFQGEWYINSAFKPELPKLRAISVWPNVFAL